LPKYAILENNKVINTIIADENFIDFFYPDAIECDENVNIFDTYKDGEFVSPPEILVPNDEALAE
jgi:hypothetical protein